MGLLIVNWILRILAQLAITGIIVFPILTLVFAISESKLPADQSGKKSWKKTKVFGILTVVSLFALIIINVLLGVLVSAVL